MTELRMNCDPVDMTELLSSKSMFRVPEYQRQFEWGTEQFRQLWEDIQDAIKYDRMAHHLNEIKFVPSVESDGPKRLDIIDGQQRITTVSILIAVLRDEYENRGRQEKYSEELSALLETKDMDANRIRSLRLLNEGSDDKNYRQVYEGVSTASELSGSVGEAYGYFRKRVKQISDEDLDNTRQFVIHRLTIVKTVVQELMQAFIMFESTNSRGLELAETDVVKAILMRIAHRNGEDSEVAQKQWTEVLELATDADKSKPTRAIKDTFRVRSDLWGGQTEVSGDFTEKMRDIFARQSAGSVTETLDQLSDWLEVYKRVKNARVSRYSDSENEHINALIRQFNERNPHSGIVLFWLHQNISEPAPLITALDWASKLSLRLFLAERTAHKKRSAIHRAFRQLEGGADPKAAFRKQMRESTPSDQALEVELRRKEFKRNTATQMVLYRTEVEHFGGLVGGSQYPTPGESVDVEHIAPIQSFSAKKYSRWRSVLDGNEDRFSKAKRLLGNLTLLRSRRNQEAGTDPFEQKAARYENSEFNMSLDVADNFSEWGFEQIEKRSETMANRVVRSFSAGSHTSQPVSSTKSDGGQLSAWMGDDDD